MLKDAALHGLKRMASYLPLHRQAMLVSRVLPRSRWYRAALSIARAQGRLVARMGGNEALTAALMLDHWLRELSFFGPYPLPFRTLGMEVCRRPGPMLLCWTHVPLLEVTLRAYLEEGGAPIAVVADPGKIVGKNEFQVFGWPDRMEALPADPHLLARVRKTLRAGKPVVYLADPYLGGPMSDIPVRLAGLLDVPLVLQWVDVLPDDTFLVTSREAPFPKPRTEEEIAENMRFLREARDRRLAELGFGAPPG